MADSGDVDSDDIIEVGAPNDEMSKLERLENMEKNIHTLIQRLNVIVNNNPSFPHTEEQYPPPKPEDFAKRYTDFPVSNSDTNDEHNWDNLNEREKFILLHIKKIGKFSTDNYEKINRAWSKELGIVTQSRFSQIISNLIKGNWLKKIGSKGTGSSRIVVISSNAKSNLGDIDMKNIKKKPSNSYERWSKQQESDLENYLCSGKKIGFIAKKMQRTESSIRSRIRFLDS
jgi:hypothetical protein